MKPYIVLPQRDPYKMEPAVTYSLDPPPPPYPQYSLCQLYHLKNYRLRVQY